MSVAMSRRERRKNYDYPTHLAELDDDADEAEQRHGQIMGTLRTLVLFTITSSIGLILNLVYAQLGH